MRSDKPKPYSLHSNLLNNNKTMIQDDRYLRLLSEKFPNRRNVATEIINLQSILSLPKGTEHFVSDLHGADEAFINLLKNASGVVRKKVDEVFGDTLNEDEKRDLCTLIYYPEECLASESERHKAVGNVAKIIETMHRVIEVARAVTVKYSRSKVRKLLPRDFAYVMEELLFESPKEPGRKHFYAAILQSVIDTEREDELIIAFCFLIHTLAIDTLHIVGDVYDRGPGACKIMDVLGQYHHYDIQWGNHDIEWMGAAAGNPALIATVLRVSIRYANIETLEEDYGINLLPLATFAMQTYRDDPCTIFQTKDFENNPRLRHSAQIMAKMHKAISIIQFKLEGQLIQRHPEYKMQDRLLLDKIDPERGIICINGREYPLTDTNLPTLNPAHPYRLTRAEKQLMDQLLHSFRRSRKMQEHLDQLYKHGSLYKISNGFLLYHAAIPLNEDGTFMEIEYGGKTYKGRALMDETDRVIRAAYYEQDQDALDFMWYLWCGYRSPLYHKDKMTTLERYFVDNKQVQHESNGAYYSLANTEKTCNMILREFGLSTRTGRIINGHIPVKTTKGETPMRAGGKRLVIDGGFAKPYQEKTGIAGYTLIYNSHGIQLVEHESFESREQAIQTGGDIHSRTLLQDFTDHRMLIRDTDTGRELLQQVADLKQLLQAYQSGILPEK